MAFAQYPDYMHYSPKKTGVYAYIVERVDADAFTGLQALSSEAGNELPGHSTG